MHINRIILIIKGKAMDPVGETQTNYLKKSFFTKPLNLPWQTVAFAVGGVAFLALGAYAAAIISLPATFALALGTSSIGYLFFKTCVQQKTTPNKALKDAYIDLRAEFERFVKEIRLSNDFYKDPVAHLLNKMIKRGVGRACTDDGARSFVMSEIPGFIEKVNSPDYLRSFALEYFKDRQELDKIMDVFDNSIKGAEFKQQLNKVVSLFEKNQYYVAERELRTALMIFPQSKKLVSYTYPIEAGMHKCL
jgi:hypothetical protein